MFRNLFLFLVSLFSFIPTAAAVVTAQSSVPDIVVINESTHSQAEAQKIVSAVQTQVQRDFAPIYKLNARITLAEKGAPVSPTAWRLFLFDDSNDHLLGFHSVGANYVPQARVFVEKCLRYKQPPSLVVSHEVLEMLANPFIVNTFVVEDGDNVTVYLYEVADAVQNARCGYDIEGVRVSDFVLPPWFDLCPLQKDSGRKMSFNNCVTKPLEIANQGYMPVMRLKRAKAGASWENKW